MNRITKKVCGILRFRTNIVRSFGNTCMPDDWYYKVSYKLVGSPCWLYQGIYMNHNSFGGLGSKDCGCEHE